MLILYSNYKLFTFDLINFIEILGLITISYVIIRCLWNALFNFLPKEECWIFEENFYYKKSLLCFTLSKRKILINF